MWQDKHSFRELDEQLAMPKGTAFKAFKALINQFKCNEDYWRLTITKDADSIAQLKKIDKIYQSSVNVILLSHKTYQILLSAIQNLHHDTPHNQTEC